MTSIYSNIDRNKRETVLIVVGFIFVITLLAWFIGEVFYGSGLTILGLAFIFSGVTGIFSYYNSDKIVLSISGAKELKVEQYPEVDKLVENMTIASGLPKPRLYVIEDSALNAFATGRDPENAVICFTSGIIKALNKRELEGVVAHEMAHIGNYDIRLMSIVSILVGTVALVSDIMLRGFIGGRSRKGGNLTFFIAIGLLILSPIIAALIKLALSRNREYLADSTGALMTRNPDALASALQKISSSPKKLEAANSATAHMYISNPFLHDSSSLRGLFNTHPPVEERIKRLQEM